jgi:uncharacterized membrane protein
MARISYVTSCAALIALTLLCLAWELWLAPLRPGGSWVALKILPLLAPLAGILRRRIYTYQWSSMLILAYFIEGAVRGYSETGLAGQLARAEIMLSLLFFCGTIAYVGARRRKAGGS